MALTGHLSDLSLSELIEFFCNQRKTGCLNVRYPQGSGSFYLQSGSVVDAKIGMLRGIDAVYYALTLPNAAFEFRGAAEMPERSINQPWTQVVLEGLRRLDEGITPAEAFPDGPIANDSDNDSAGMAAADQEGASPSNESDSSVPSFLSSMSPGVLGSRKSFIAGAVAVAVLLSVAAIGVPAGWYGAKKSAVISSQPKVSASSESRPVNNSEPVSSSPSASPAADTQAADAAALAAKRQREKERAKAREDKAKAATDNIAAKPGAASMPQSASSNPEVKSGPKKVTVQVSYDESGRVVQASGADPTAVRIARQRHFPPGKAGTATITISIN
jgi:cytoskeletal protein RodZ